MHFYAEIVEHEYYSQQANICIIYPSVFIYLIIFLIIMTYQKKTKKTQVYQAMFQCDFKPVWWLSKK